MDRKKQKTKPVVEVRHSSYQPSKAELEEDMRIDASPEDVARAIGQQVEVRYSKPIPPKREKPDSC